MHATGDLFGKQIEVEPAPEVPLEWAMAGASDDEDDSTPAHADAGVSDKPELIDFQQKKKIHGRPMEAGSVTCPTVVSLFVVCPVNVDRLRIPGSYRRKDRVLSVVRPSNLGCCSLVLPVSFFVIQHPASCTWSVSGRRFWRLRLNS